MSDGKANRPGLAGGSGKRLAGSQYILIVDSSWPACQVGDLPRLIRQADRLTRKHRRLAKRHQMIYEHLKTVQRQRGIRP